MSGDRQLVRTAIAAYFGGTLQASDAGVYCQGGPLAAAGLGTAFPYMVKRVPDTAYLLGQSSGGTWGACLTVHLGDARITRKALGGAVGGWRLRRYTAVCDLDVLSTAPHLETAEAGLDDLIDGLLGLIYADRTLGTTSDTYPTGRLITEAGEMPDGIAVGDPVFTVEDGSRSRGGCAVTFSADTYVMA